MPWIIEPINHKSYTAKYGECLKDTCRYDPYEMSCVIEDRGDGIAYIENASGKINKIPSMKDFRKKLKELGFKKARWIRIVDIDISDKTQKKDEV